MCGICGFLHHDAGREASSRQLSEMTATLAHRGPDGEGFFTKGNLALGHRRLAIIDLATGDQPMFNDDGSIALVLNGEIYNYVELRAELENLGHHFRTTSDTEVLLRGYEEWGLDVHERLNGMWGFALWDDRKQQLVLSRDRMGEKPLHYALWDNTLLFGSEIKCLIAYGVPQEPNLDVLELYLGLGYIPAPHTFYRHVRKLPPGSYLLCHNGQCRVHSYWQLPTVDERDLLQDSGEARERFEALFFDAVRIRMRSDVPFGAFLSGGLDSASVVSQMAQHSERPLETFTIGFREREFDERGLARQVAERFGTNHHENVVTQDSFDESLRRIGHHYDEPFGDSSAIPTGYVARYARQRVTMVLTGDGGDEVLSGYPGYQSEKLAVLYSALPGFVQGIPPAVLNSAARLMPARQGALLRRLGGVAAKSSLAFDDRLAQKVSWLESARLRQLLAPLGHRTIPLGEYLGDFMKNCPYRDGFYRLMYFNLNFSLPEHMLVKVDRMTMAHSLEGRIPFLDHRLIEFMVGVHKNVKMRGFERKSVLRRTIGRTLPPSILRGSKRGFEVPVREWFKNRDLVDRLQPMLAKTPLDLSPTVIGEIIEENASGRRNHGNFLWMLFVLADWFDR
jgi:asparagine synthase (glutamine-hydrolysing)